MVNAMGNNIAIKVSNLSKKYALYEKPQHRFKEVFSLTKRSYHKDFFALSNIEFEVQKGETVGIVGTNGSGKSTLLKIITGVLQPTNGTVNVCGKISALLELGAGFNQEYTGRQNIFLNGRMMGFSKKEMEDKEQAIIDFADIGDFIHQPVKTYSSGMFVRLAFAVAINIDPEILIVDEALSVGDVFFQAKCYKKFEEFKEQGKTIIFITHKLNEIMEVADRCTILRKGKYVGTVNVKDTTKEELSKMMVGRNVNFSVDKKPAKPGETVLKVEHMTVPSKAHSNNAVKDISFNVRRGEIVCIAGIDGNGQSEFVQGLTGLEKITGGKILFKGQDITKASIRERSKMGMSHIPEDRHKHGLVLDYSLEDNIVLERYFEPQFTNRFGFLKRKEIRKYANRLIKQYDIRSGQGPVTKVRSMSGGNQQKAIIAREIDKDPKFLIAVQPTRGLDVGAIEYIHKQIVAERDAGKGVLLVSLELDEVMNVSDRILVMYEGELVGQLDPKQITVEELGLYMAGAKKEAVPEEV